MLTRELTKLWIRAHSDEGATAAEYGLLVALIALIIVAGVTLFGQNLLAFFNKIAGAVAKW